MSSSCVTRRNDIAIDMANRAIDDGRSGEKEQIKAIWLETSGCFGEVISLLDSHDLDVVYILEQFVNMQFYGTIMADLFMMNVQEEDFLIQEFC